ncbi:hypothetical protein ACROYT_G044144 [Oculina patagonica]
MGISCSCDKSARYKDAILSRAEPYLATVKSKVGMNKTNQRKEQNERSLHEKPEGDFKKAVKDSVDIDPCEGKDESVVPQIKEIKVLPPIRNRTNTMAHISYTPNRVWGGSVTSYLDTIKRDSCIDENLITGGKKRERRASSLTQHKLRRSSQSGQLISWEKHVTVLSEVDEPEDSIKMSALKKRRLSYRRNSELVSMIKI